MPNQVDYDSVSSTYDRRYQDNPLHIIRDALEDLISESGARTILEVGCGTGHWLANLAAPGRRLLGLDPSRGMLQCAYSRMKNLHLYRSTARFLPFQAGSINLLYVVNAFHHFKDPAGFLREAWRVLTEGGILSVIGNDPMHPQYQWYIYDWFPGTYPRDLERFECWSYLKQWASETGFSRLQKRTLHTIEECSFGREVFDNPFLKKSASSQLILLSDEDYEAGLEKMKQAINHAEKAGQQIHFQTVLPVEMFRAEKPAAPIGRL
ncbi:MAG: class I SAM-dependent methyltransferase [Anaerolineales bacterium]|nr:class I SAM-dependent methyltransferase [Anaerolineales bacterium]